MFNSMHLNGPPEVMYHEWEEPTRGRRAVFRVDVPPNADGLVIEGSAEEMHALVESLVEQLATMLPGDLPAVPPQMSERLEAVPE